MPSPIGHAIAGLAAGWLVAGAPRTLRDRTSLREAGLYAALGMLPDVDLLVGMHSGPTHSIGAAAVVGAVALAAGGRRAGRQRIRIALACLAAYLSHVLLDWLGTDASPPLGIMALWPLSRAYYESDLHIFMAISRRYYQGWTFVYQNLQAMAMEVVILVPLLVVIFFLRRRRSAIAPVVAVLTVLSNAPVAEARAQPPSLQSAGVESVLGAYRRGAIEASANQLARLLSTEGGQRQINRWISDARDQKRREDLEAVMMLLSEATIRIWKPDDPFPERFLPPYSAAIRRVHLALKDLESGTPFLRAWYLMWESFRQANFSRPPPIELDYINAAVAEFPRDARILLAAGSRHEVNWWNSREKARLSLSSQPVSVTRQLTAARDLFRRSLEADPNETEARLRLIRVLLELDDLKSAAEVMARHDWSMDEPLDRYLAAMLEGDLQERKEDYVAAGAAYDRASKIVDRPQSALVAKAHIEHLRGRRADAARTVGQSLTDNGKASDPWAPFIYGQAWRYDAYLKGVRAMVIK